MEWKVDDKRYANGENLFLGPWCVGGVHYSYYAAKNDPLKYGTSISLPSFRHRYGNFKTIDEAKAKVEEGVQYWLSQIPKGDVQE